MNSYARYLESLLGEGNSLEAAGAVYTSLAVTADHFSLSACPDPQFKLMEVTKPVVNIAPSTLYYDVAQYQLRADYWSDLYIGLQLTFPKFYSLESEQHELLRETAALPGRELFEAIRKGNPAHTVPCGIVSASRVHRTPIRMSESLRERLRNHTRLAASNLRVA